MALVDVTVMHIFILYYMVHEVVITTALHVLQHVHNLKGYCEHVFYLMK